MAEASFSAGSSLETAIVLLHSDSGRTVKEQYRVLGELFGTRLSTWFPIGRTLISHDSRTYEKIEIQSDTTAKKTASCSGVSSAACRRETRSTQPSSSRAFSRRACARSAASKAMSSE